jgi:hypothetical protein
LKIKPLPPQEYLLDCFENIGPHLIWLKRPVEHFYDYRIFSIWNTKHAGNIAGNKTPWGYIEIALNGIKYKAHRLVYKLHSGEEPHIIDHINRIRHDNRFENLRSGTFKQNSSNRTLSKRNKTGYNGIYDTYKGFIVQDYINGQHVHVGIYPTIEEAIEAKKAWDLA